MPRYWHDKHSLDNICDDAERDFCRSIVAEKKPYFMRYIYPSLMNQYRTYVKNTNRNCLIEFQMTVDELKNIPKDERTDRQSEFLKFYDLKMPVGDGDCTMNKICRLFENEFDGFIKDIGDDAHFDYSILKGNTEYTMYRYKKIASIYSRYSERLKILIASRKREKIDSFNMSLMLQRLDEDFVEECDIECQDRDMLCNIVLDMCYKKATTKRFAWSMCGDVIIKNLLANNNNIINVIRKCDDGDIYYGGDRFEVVQKELEVVG